MAVSFAPETVKVFARSIADSLVILDSYRRRLAYAGFDKAAEAVASIFDMFADLLSRDVIWFDDVYITVDEAIKKLRFVLKNVRSEIDSMYAEVERKVSRYLRRCMRTESEEVCMVRAEARRAEMLREVRGYEVFYNELRSVVDAMITFLDLILRTIPSLARYAPRKRQGVR